MKEHNYLAATIEFLDRESQNKKAMCYPITRITLHQRMHYGNPRGRPWRRFIIDEQGDSWVEIPVLDDEL